MEAAAIPLHNVVVADRALVMKAEDAVQILGSGTPGLFGVAGRASEATVVVGKEIAQDSQPALQVALAVGQQAIREQPRLVKSPGDEAISIRKRSCENTDCMKGTY